MPTITDSSKLTLKLLINDRFSKELPNKLANPDIPTPFYLELLTRAIMQSQYECAKVILYHCLFHSYLTEEMSNLIIENANDFIVNRDAEGLQNLLRMDEFGDFFNIERIKSLLVSLLAEDALMHAERLEHDEAEHDDHASKSCLVLNALIDYRRKHGLQDGLMDQLFLNAIESNCSIPVIRNLLNHGARLDAKTEHNETAIMVAARSARVDLLPLLVPDLVVYSGKEIDYPASFERLLPWASELGFHALVVALFDHMSLQNVAASHSHFESSAAELQSYQLLRAQPTMEQKLEPQEQLEQQYPNPPYVVVHATPLDTPLPSAPPPKTVIDCSLKRAIQNNHQQTAKVLLENGANPLGTIFLDEGQAITPLEFAFDYGQTTIASEMIDRILTPPKLLENLNLALFLAIKNNHLEKIEALLQSGANPFVSFAGYQEGAESAFQVSFNHELTGRILFDFFYNKGAILSNIGLSHTSFQKFYPKQNLQINPRLSDQQQHLLSQIKTSNQTPHPIFDAMKRKDKARVKDYVKILGKDINELRCLTNPQNPFLHEVCANKDIDVSMLQYLLETCEIIDVNKLDDYKNTPLMYAAHNQQLDKVRELIKFPVDFEKPSLNDNPYLNSSYKIILDKGPSSEIDVRIASVIYKEMKRLGTPLRLKEFNDIQKRFHQVVVIKNHEDIGLIEIYKRKYDLEYKIKDMQALLKDPRLHLDALGDDGLTALDYIGLEVNKSSDELDEFNLLTLFFTENDVVDYDKFLHWAASKGHASIARWIINETSKPRASAPPESHVYPLGFAQSKIYSHPPSEIPVGTLEKNDGGLSESFPPDDESMVGNIQSHEAIIPASQDYAQIKKQMLNQDIDGKTPIEIAIENNHPDMVSFLLKEGAELPCDENGLIKEELFKFSDKTLSNIDAMYEVYKFFRLKGISFPAGEKGRQFLAKLTNGGPYKKIESPLIEAAKNGDLDKVKEELETGSNLHALCGSGYNALHHASDGPEDGSGVINYLVSEKSMDVNFAESKKNQTPLHLAVIANREKNIKALLNLGADLEAKTTTKNTPYQIAVKKGFGESAKIIFMAMRAKGIPIEYYLKQKSQLHTDFMEEFKDTESLLNQAIIDTQDESIDETLQLILKEGYKLNGVGVKGNTPLMTAVIAGKISALNFLLGKDDIDLDAKNDEGLTALELAVSLDNLRISIALFEKGLVGKSEEEETLFKAICAHNAIRHGNLDFLKFLSKNHNIDFEKASTLLASKVFLVEGATLLSLAAQYAKPEIVLYLLEQRLSPEAEDTHKRQPIHWASSNSRGDDDDYLSNLKLVIRILYQRMTKPVLLAEENKKNSKETNELLICIKKEFADELQAKIKEGNYEIFSTFVGIVDEEGGVAPPKVDIDEEASNGESALITLARAKAPDVEIGRYLLRKSKQRNHTIVETGENALIIAIENNVDGSHQALIAGLIEGADDALISQSDKSEKDALLHAVEKEDSASIQALLSHDYYKDSPSKISIGNAIIKALQQGNQDVITTLYDNASPNSEEKDDFNAFCVLQAIIHNNLSFLKHIESQNDDLDYQRLAERISGKGENKLSNGTNFLTVAAQHGQLEIVQHLFEKRVPINVKDSTGRFPIHWASDPNKRRPHEKTEADFTSVVQLLYKKMDKPVSLFPPDSPLSGANALIREVKQEFGGQLQQAVFNNSARIISRLIDDGVWVDEHTISANPALYYAINSHVPNSDCLTTLLDKGASLSQTFNVGDQSITPLAFAVRKNEYESHREVIRTLIGKITASSSSGKISIEDLAQRSLLDSALSVAVEKNDLTTVQDILAQVNYFEVPPTAEPQRKELDKSPLLLAIKKSKNNIAECLLNALPEKDARLPLVYKELAYQAIYYGNLDFLKLIVAKNNNKLPLEDGEPLLKKQPILSYAANTSTLEIVKYLVEDRSLNVDATDRSNMSALHYALLRDDNSQPPNERSNICEYLYEKMTKPVPGFTKPVLSTKIDLYNKLESLKQRQGNLLRGHIKDENKVVLESLLTGSEQSPAKVWVDEFDSYGIPPLIHAIRENKLEIASLLLNKGANVNQIDSNQRPALHYAVETNNPEWVKLLLINGANINPEYNPSPLLHAIESGKFEAAKALLDWSDQQEISSNKIQINQQDRQGYTALMRAVEKGNEPLVSRLLNMQEINVGFTNDNNDSSLRIAIKKRFPTIASWLLPRSTLEETARVINNHRTEIADTTPEIRELFALKYLEDGPSSTNIQFRREMNDIISFQRYYIEHYLKHGKADYGNLRETSLSGATRDMIINQVKEVFSNYDAPDINTLLSDLSLSQERLIDKLCKVQSLRPKITATPLTTQSTQQPSGLFSMQPTAIGDLSDRDKVQNIIQNLKTNHKLDFSTEENVHAWQRRSRTTFTFFNKSGASTKYGIPQTVGEIQTLISRFQHTGNSENFIAGLQKIQIDAYVRKPSSKRNQQDEVSKLLVDLGNIEALTHPPHAKTGIQGTNSS